MTAMKTFAQAVAAMPELPTNISQALVALVCGPVERCEAAARLLAEAAKLTPKEREAWRAVCGRHIQETTP